MKDFDSFVEFINHSQELQDSLIDVPLNIEKKTYNLAPTVYSQMFSFLINLLLLRHLNVPTNTKRISIR